jgi:hypothetical protein
MRHDIQHKDTEHNGIQHNDTQYEGPDLWHLA